MTTAAAYCGQDRRARDSTAMQERRGASAATHRPGGLLLLLFLLLLSLAALSGPVAGHYLDDPSLGQLRQGLATMGVSLFVAGGLAYLLRWKLTGEAPVALVGVALLVYGVGVGLFLPLAPMLLHSSASSGVSSSLVRAVVSLMAMYLLVRSLSTAIVDSKLRPVRTAVVAVLGIAATFAVLGAIVRLRGVASPPVTLDVSVHAVLSMGWAGAAYLLVRRAVDRLLGDVLWVGLALGCLSVANGIRVLGGGNSPPGLLAAAAVSVLAAAVALYGTTLHLSQILAVRGSERLRLHVDLVTQEVHQRTQRASREERLHDVRSTLAAIRMAAGTLQRHEDRLESGQRERLQSAVTQELVRLEQLIDPPPADQLQTLVLDDVITPLVETERALGAHITMRLRGVPAYARPQDVARIVQNLLTNARRHAPDSPVRVTTTLRDGVVAVVVADEGPGVKVTQRTAIFERGRSGKASGGTGLGLYVARQLALDLGGNLAVHDRIGGGAVFVLTLQSAAPEPVDDQIAGSTGTPPRSGRRSPTRTQKHGWLPGPRQPEDVVAVAPGVIHLA
jgi:signal transduction histidine kinase